MKSTAFKLTETRPFNILVCIYFWDQTFYFVYTVLFITEVSQSDRIDYFGSV